MGRVNDLTNIKYGRLLAISFAGLNKQRNALWNCVCDCGETTVVSAMLLRLGKTQSCGCLHREVVSNTFSKDLTGTVINELTVLERLPRNFGKHTRYRCLCSCGKETTVSVANLVSGSIKACGHLHVKPDIPTWESYIAEVGETKHDSFSARRMSFRNKRVHTLRRQVLSRDSNRCILCGATGVLNVHHVYPFSTNPKLAHSTDFMVALCARSKWEKINPSAPKCHDLAHKNNLRGPVDSEIQQRCLEYLAKFKTEAA